MSDMSCCGTDCSQCGYYGGLCKGCNACKGKVFYCEPGKACSIYECVIQKKKYHDCSVCPNIPCDIWKANRDPKYSDEEFETSINERIANLRNSQ